jgi:phage gp29-like protein
MAKVIRSKTFKAIMKEILWTQFWGVNGLEFIPGRNIAYNMVLKKHIKIKTQLITYEQFGLTEGIDYTKLSNVWILGDEHVTGGDGASHDLGLLSVCCFLSLLKKGVISDWAQYIQIFGSPAIVVKYKGFDNQAQLAAEKILKNIGNSMRMTIPDLMNVEFVDGKMANGNGDLQNAFRKACNEELVVLVLGNTETTGHGSGTTGVGAKAHGNQQLEIIRDDMDYLTDNLNSDQFMHILKSYALPVDGAYFDFDKEVDVEYLKSFMPVVVQAATQIGLPVSKKQLYDITGLMQPEDEADTIQLYPTLGQQPTTNDPDTEDGKPSPAKPSAPRPVSRSKAKPEAISLSDVSAMLDEKLRAFFAQAL